MIANGDLIKAGPVKPVDLGKSPDPADKRAITAVPKQAVAAGPEYFRKGKSETTKKCQDTPSTTVTSPTGAAVGKTAQLKSKKVQTKPKTSQPPQTGKADHRPGAPTRSVAWRD